MGNLEPTIKLAIVGGGPSAAAILEAVLQHLTWNISITVFDPTPHLWCGYAFQPDGHEVLSNVSMSIMSVRPNDREHGVRWLTDQGFDSYTAQTTFPPRPLVGQYLRSSAQQAIAALIAAGSSVAVEKLSVLGLEQRQDKLWVIGDEWTRGPFDHAILCPGTSKTYDPYQLSGHQGYVSAPYPLRSSLRNIPIDARVAIIGSGLTAVDTVMALHNRGHTGPISMVSRNGLLPSVRSAPVQHTVGHLTQSKIKSLVSKNGGIRISDVTALAQTELKEAGADLSAIVTDVTDQLTPEQQLRKDLKCAQESDSGWPILRSGLIGCGQHAWYFLTDEDKALLRAVNHKLMRFLCPMPLRTAERLLELLESKQLEVIDSITSVQPTTSGSSGFEIRATRDIACDFVIGASTPATREASGNIQTLIASLLSQGLAVSNPFGGLDVDLESSRLINPLGISNPHIHALGDLTSGAYFFIFGLSILVDRADCIVRDISTFTKAAKSATKPTPKSPMVEM